jgi:ABC-type phosphate/phosphonate transport system substrate-binding protein
MSRRPHVAACALAFCALLLLPCATRAGGENPFGPRGLRFAYSADLLSDVTRADAEAALGLWTRELARVAGYAVGTRMAVYDDLQAMVDAARHGDVDLIALGTLDYLKIRGRVPMEAALVGIRGGRPGDEDLLLVRTDSGIRTLEQLVRRRLVLQQGGSGRIASLWFDSLLANGGLPPAERFLSETKVAAKTQQVILAVFFGHADACVVGSNAFRTAAELNPQIGRDMTVLATSPVYPVAISCLRSTMTPAQKEEFRRMAFGMAKTASGRQILTLFKVDAIAGASDSTLEELAVLVKSLEGRKSASKRTKP